MIGKRRTNSNQNGSSSSLIYGVAASILVGGLGLSLVLDNLHLLHHKGEARQVLPRRILSTAFSSASSSNVELFTQREKSISEKMRDYLLNDTSRIWEFEEDGRPIMNTFFHPISGQVAQKDAMVIAAWKHGWSQSGWNPRVLSLKDAKKHAKYEEMNDAIRHMHPAMLRNEYETMCYLRYIAVAANGGGHMSDYDTIPLNFLASEELLFNSTTNSTTLVLPNGGNFTTYGNHVPALLSGRPEEWDRIVKRLVEEGKQRGDLARVFSDMSALEQIIQQDKNEVHVMTPMQVLQPHHLNHNIGGFVALLTGKFKKPSFGTSCSKLHVLRAMHISHYAMYDKGYDTLRRGLYMGKVMQTYHDSCGGPEFFESIAKELGIPEEKKEDEEAPKEDEVQNSTVAEKEEEAPKVEEEGQQIDVKLLLEKKDALKKEVHIKTQQRIAEEKAPSTMSQRQILRARTAVN